MMDDLNELINTKVLNIKNLIEQNIVDESVTKGRAQEALEECRIICRNLLEEIRKNIDNAEVYEYAAEENYRYATLKLRMIIRLINQLHRFATK